jgi:hypothetical protein
MFSKCANAHACRQGRLSDESGDRQIGGAGNMLLSITRKGYKVHAAQQKMS